MSEQKFFESVSLVRWMSDSKIFGYEDFNELISPSNSTDWSL
jgi:hypothetical protein